MATVAFNKAPLTVSLRKETLAWLREQGGSKGMGQVIDLLVQRERLTPQQKVSSQVIKQGKEMQRGQTCG